VGTHYLVPIYSLSGIRLEDQFKCGLETKIGSIFEKMVIVLYWG
jgi:hypothetical protein